MSRRGFVVFVIVVLGAVPAFAADPAAAISAGRQALNNRQYDVAVKTLQEAVPDAANLPEPQRTQALAALHFYTALAFNAMNEDRRTREELEQFFALSPKTNSIDASKYDAAFVKRFNETAKALNGAASANFDAVYPGFRTFAGVEPRPRTLPEWGEGPDLTLLGTPDEKREWKQLADDTARQAFVDAFWRRRDRTPDTPENEFRREFMGRVAFADETFATAKSRGALTDRGRVFILLGAPKIIRQGNLSQAEGGGRMAGGNYQPRQTEAAGGNYSDSWRAVDAANKNAGIAGTKPIAKGKVERWIYGRDQLPRSIPDDQLAFKFVTEEGYGESVLQRDHLALKALADAATR